MRLDKKGRRGQNDAALMTQRKTPVKGKKRGGDLLVPCLYFERPGPQNTRRTLDIAAARAEELGIGQIVVASSSGRTGAQAASLFRGKNLVVVTHSTGFLKPGFQELKPAMRRKIEAHGGQILTCQHAFGGVNRAVRKKLATYELDEIIAYTLRTFGEGAKVAIEISLMAADAGLISVRDPCIAIGGSSGGADTVLLLRPANAQTFFELRILEVLAKPRFFD
ncbi:MAG: pyruvate kinase alpha/beta domain-containing protein [Candidatus Aminicenantales bacterium]